MSKEDIMKHHFKPVYPADIFDPDDIGETFFESQRSKSREHTDRLQYNENSRKTEKIKENEI